MNYSITRSDHGTIITVFVRGDVFTVNNAHPNYREVKQAVLDENEDADFANLCDLNAAANAAFQRIGERVSVRNGKVYLDGDAVDNVLTRQVASFLRDGVNDFRPLVAFFEKVQANPNAHSRDQLYTWLNDRDFTITEDGDFLAYKGLREDGTSIHAGPAIVDGVPQDGNIPNAVGSVIEMPRSNVQHDPSRGCSTGLHAGTYEYASGFGRLLVKVRINPRDVVSVPTDCNGQKLRTCRYEVVEVVQERNDPALYGYSRRPDDDWAWDDESDDDWDW